VYPAAKCLPCYPPVNLPRVGLPSKLRAAVALVRLLPTPPLFTEHVSGQKWTDARSHRRRRSTAVPQYIATYYQLLPTYSLSAPPSQAASRAHPSLTNLVLLRQISPEP
jgi:hypothetical protein